MINVDGIRMLDKRDIAAMKLWAITKRGSKKDFWDLFYLLKEFSMAEILEFFTQKFPEVNPFFVIKSLSYFGDADEELDPEKIKPITWDEVKEEVRVQVTGLLNG